MSATSLWTMFIEHTGCHYLARDNDGEAMGIIYVPEYPEDYIIGVHVVDRMDCSYELLNDAQVGTYREFELMPDLHYLKRKEVNIRTVSGTTMKGYQLNYEMPEVP